MTKEANDVSWDWLSHNEQLKQEQRSEDLCISSGTYSFQSRPELPAQKCRGGLPPALARKFLMHHSLKCLTCPTLHVRILIFGKCQQYPEFSVRIRRQFITNRRICVVENSI